MRTSGKGTTFNPLMQESEIETISYDLEKNSNNNHGSSQKKTNELIKDQTTGSSTTYTSSSLKTYPKGTNGKKPGSQPLASFPPDDDEEERTRRSQQTRRTSGDSENNNWESSYGYENDALFVSERDQSQRVGYRTYIAAFLLFFGGIVSNSNLPLSLPSSSRLLFIFLIDFSDSWSDRILG